jgi:integrase/recombinase XerD
MELSTDNLNNLSGTDFPENLKSRGKQPSTVESYSRDASRFLEFMQEKKLRLANLEPDILVEYENYLRNECDGRTNSVRRSMIGVRQFFRFLVDKKVLRESPFDAVPLPARDEDLPDQLDDEDVAMLIEAAAASSPPIKAARDRAIVTLLAYEGLKASELIHLVWTDIMLDDNLAAWGSLSIPGDKGRTIILGPESATALDAYRTLFREWSAKRPGVISRMFISFKGRESAVSVPTMTRHGLKFVMYELGEKIGVSGLNSELLRHHAIRHQLALGKSPEDLMGHLGLRRLGNIARHNARPVLETSLHKGFGDDDGSQDIHD